MTHASTAQGTIVGAIYRQFAPAIRMLQNAIDACPDDLWVAEADGPAIWEQAYHTTFWLFAWARDWQTPFEMPSFHSQDALELRPGATPVITRAQLAEYAQQARDACLSYLGALTPESLLEPQDAFGKTWTPAERVLCQIRHVQHHVGVMNGRINKHLARPLQWIDSSE